TACASSPTRIEPTSKELLQEQHGLTPAEHERFDRRAPNNECQGLLDLSPAQRAKALKELTTLKRRQTIISGQEFDQLTTADACVCCGTAGPYGVICWRAKCSDCPPETDTP